MAQGSAAWSDEELVDRLMTGDDEAIREMNVRYGPLLQRQAKRRGLEPLERREFVCDVLADVALRLMEPAATRPQRLRGYLVATVDRRLIDRHRRLVAAPPTVELDEPGGTHDAEASERALQHDAAASSTVRALAAALEQAMDEADRELLLWLGERIPQRVIAEWLEMTDGALRTYVSRLRQRLREVARGYAAALPEQERAAVARYFERFPAAGATAAPRPTRRTPTRRRHDTST
jgi:RNA polymerase sigma factor (sigma-70 family)